MALALVPVNGEPTVPTAARSSFLGRWAVANLLVAVVALTGCRGSEDARVRRVWELGRRPTEPNRNRIERMFQDPDRDVRSTVLVVLATIDPARAGRLALVAIDDRDGLVRGAAVKIVGTGPISDPALVRRLAALVQADPAWQVRRQALEALGPIDDPAVPEAFVRALSDSVRHVRRTALRAATERTGLLPLDRVASLITDDPDWENRVEAAQVLGASKDPAAYAGLDAAMHDPNEFVRATAARERRGLAQNGVPEPATTPAEGKPRSGV